MRQLLRTLACLPLLAALAGPASAETVEMPTGSTLMYTTYFYTAGEAVIHGYEADTAVRVVSMSTNEPVWEGTVGVGQTRYVPTGPGVFGFLSDKKAGILVGTPSSCTVVGFWLRDRDGFHRSDHFYTQLPSGGGGEDDRLVVWVVGDTELSITDVSTDAVVVERQHLRAGSRLEITGPDLAALRSHVLDVRASSPDVLVQVYQDEGYTVPATSGRGAGREFLTYVGRTTNGQNDLNLISYHADARVRVADVDSGETIWEGEVPGGSAHTLTLAGRTVRVVSDREISVIVAPYVHYTGTYAEHHFAMGAEGGGIDNDFILPSTGELWIFSYYADNQVQVHELASGREVWTGTLQAGAVRGLHPGHGFYRVRSQRGLSVMGGAAACGAEYSPAAGMFAVDEALMAAVVDIQQQRIDEAASRGQVLSHDEIHAPLSAVELEQAVDSVRASTGSSSFKAAEASERLRSMVTE